MSFANLKKQSKLGSLTEKLVKEVEKLNSAGSSEDDRYWKLTTDKSQNGYAVIRFLPAPDNEDIPFVKIYSHAFQGSGGWLIDNCVTTLGQQCPPPLVILRSPARGVSKDAKPSGITKFLHSRA